MEIAYLIIGIVLVLICAYALIILRAIALNQKLTCKNQVGIATILNNIFESVKGDKEEK